MPRSFEDGAIASLFLGSYGPAVRYANTLQPLADQLLIIAAHRIDRRLHHYLNRSLRS